MWNSAVEGRVGGRISYRKRQLSGNFTSLSLFIEKILNSSDVKYRFCCAGQVWAEFNELEASKRIITCSRASCEEILKYCDGRVGITCDSLGRQVIHWWWKLLVMTFRYAGWNGAKIPLPRRVRPAKSSAEAIARRSRCARGESSVYFGMPE